MRSRFVFRRTCQAMAAVAALAAVPVLVPTSASASEQKAQHCVVEAIGVLPSGELETTPATCFTTFEEAMASVGLAARSVADLDAGALRLSTLIAVHYDLTNGVPGGAGTYSVSSVTSPACSGFKNMPPYMANAVSSTWSICDVRHHDDPNQSGTYLDTPPGTNNLGGMNNRTESASYS